MPFERPTLLELIDRSKAELAGRLGLPALLPRGPADALAKVTAGASHLQHGHLDWIARQVFVDTADASELDRIAGLWGITRKAATYGQGLVIFAGVDGSVVPAGTRLRRADNIEYSTDVDGTVAAGSASIAVTATASGATSDCDAGTTFTLVSPVAGVSSPATAGPLGIFGGFDQEADPALRARVLERIQNPPGGGTIADYQTWALAVAGVTRVWVYPLGMGLGSVVVLFVTDGAPSGSIPTQDAIDEVTAALELERPITTTLYVAAPIALTLDLVIHISPDNSTTRAAVTASISDLITRESAPGGTLLISHLEEAIGTAGGIDDYSVTTPVGDVIAAAGHLPQLGTITWN